MSRDYQALTAKVKAMYGKRLKSEDFFRMARMASVDEVYADLRGHPVWGGGVARLSEGARFGRAKLEAALRNQIREEYVRLSAFIPREDRAFMEFPILRSELDGLLFTLARLGAGRVGEPEPLPTSFIRHSKTDEDALTRCTDYEGLLEAARKSIYYQPLSRLRPPPGKLPDFTLVESALFTVYYDHILNMAERRYEGDARALLCRGIGTQVDMLNLMHILRLKRFFPEEDDFAKILFPCYYKLKPAQVREMCAAPDLAAALDAAARTPYGKLIRNASVEDLSRLYDESLFRLSRRQLMQGKPSIYVAVAFLNLRELELKELITVIETVKYQAPYDGRFAALFGK